MAAPLAYVAFLLDDSSSMREHVMPTIHAFNAYTETLKDVKGAEIRFSLWKFGGGGLSDDPVQRDVPIQDAVRLSTANYHPRSGTMLFTAITGLIKTIEDDLAKNKNQKRKVVICIQTDGESTDYYVDAKGGNHNRWEYEHKSAPASYKLTSTKAGELVRKKQAEGWEFVFMAVQGSDGFDFRNVATNQLGIPPENVMVYGQSEKATIQAFSDAAWNIGAYSSDRATHASFTLEQQQG